MKKMLKILSKFLFAASVVFVSSCEEITMDNIDEQTLLDPEQWSLEMENLPLENLVSIHEIIKYRRGEDNELMMPSSFEGDVCVNNKQLLDSTEIKSVKKLPVPDEDTFNLQLDLTDRGRKRWIGLSIAHKGEQLAFAIDGTVYRRFVPRQIYDDTTTSIIIDGPFDKITAEKLEKFSRPNFRRVGRK